MATSNIKASIPCDVHSVWKVVTEVKNYTWRSVLSKTGTERTRMDIFTSKDNETEINFT